MTDSDIHASPRFQVYVDGKPYGPSFDNKGSFVDASYAFEEHPDSAIEIIMLGPDEEPSDVITGYRKHNA